MNKMTEAIDDCSKAIELDDKYVKAYLRRAKWYVGKRIRYSYGKCALRVWSGIFDEF